ncbi:MAG: Kae1-associated kinase Bud32 [Methanotrichaceae archaeon]
MVEEIGRGAEAIITRKENQVMKKRIPKGYRTPALDEHIRRERTIQESRIISEARRCGVPTPIVLDVSKFELTMEYIEGRKLRNVIDQNLSKRVGKLVGQLHNCGIIHGDLTTSNMILKDDKIYFIDFGLAYHNQSIEAQGMDVHVYFQIINSTQDQPHLLINAFKLGYFETYPHAKDVLKRVKEIESRGRYL